MFILIAESSAGFWTIVGTIASAVVGIGGLILGYRKQVANEERTTNERAGLRADVVPRSSDPFFGQAKRIYEGDSRLPPDVRTSWELLVVGQKNQESFWFQLFKPWRLYSLFIIGARRIGKEWQTRGFLECEVYRRLHLAFIPCFINDRMDKYSSSPEDAGLSSEPSPLTQLIFEKLEQAVQSPFWPFLQTHDLYAELEDPAHFEPAGEAKARIKLFCKLGKLRGWYMYKVDLPYVQPYTDLADMEEAAKIKPQRREKQMWLILFTRDPEMKSIQKNRFEQVVHFMADLCREAEVEPRRAARYGSYLDKWVATLIKSAGGGPVPVQRIEVKPAKSSCATAKQKV